jgi:hypothetical protein
MADGAKDGKPPNSPAPTGKAKAAESVVEDLFNLDFKAPRTLFDLVFRPGRVADAALAMDHSRYTRPLKLFLAIIAAQTLVAGWLGFNDTGTFGFLFADRPAALSAIAARLAAAGSSLASADELVRQWTSWLAGPMIMVGSLLYVVVIWATRPALGLARSALLYLVAANATNTVTFPVLIATGLGPPEMRVWSAIIGFVVLVPYFGLVLHHRVAKTAAGLIARVAALTLTTIPVLLVSAILVFGAIEMAFHAKTGLSRLQLMAEGYRPSR